MIQFVYFFKVAFFSYINEFTKTFGNHIVLLTYLQTYTKIFSVLTHQPFDPGFSLTQNAPYISLLVFVADA